MAKKKKYIVVPRTTSTMTSGLQTSKGKLDFKDKTGMYVDSDLASEIDTHHGEHGSNDVWVCEDERLSWHERNDSMTDGKNAGIHHYTFSGVDMSHIRTTRDNGYVWVRKDGKEIRIKREIALAEGYVLSKKVRKARRKAEVNHG